jgi:hypothetical protein
MKIRIYISVLRSLNNINNNADICRAQIRQYNKCALQDKSAAKKPLTTHINIYRPSELCLQRQETKLQLMSCSPTVMCSAARRRVCHTLQVLNMNKIEGEIDCAFKSICHQLNNHQQFHIGREGGRAPFRRDKETASRRATARHLADVRMEIFIRSLNGSSAQVDMVAFRGITEC